MESTSARDKIPLDFLTKELCEKSLKNGLKNNRIHVKNFIILKQNEFGAHFNSNIYGVRITYEDGNSVASDKDEKIANIFVKCNWLTKEWAKIHSVLNVFRTEAAVYMKILPKFMEIHGESQRFAPRYFYNCEQPVETLVLENMTSLGYRVTNLKQGLDLQHSQLVIEKLAKFHAYSMVIFEKQPNLANDFSIGILPEKLYNESFYKLFFADGLRLLSEKLNDWGDNFIEIQLKLENIIKNYTKHVTDVMDISKDRVKVLNHGDMWFNNFLFKYAENSNVEDIVFIDFQLSFYASAGIDLNHFFNSSVNFDVLKANREILIRNYYETLKINLENLHFTNIPTFDDIKEEIKRKELYGLIIATSILPLIKMKKDIAKEIHFGIFLDPENAADERMRRSIFNSKAYDEQAKYILKRLNRIGCLDVS